MTNKGTKLKSSNCFDGGVRCLNYLFVILITVSTLSLSAGAEAAKTIAVVLDDSGSMAGTGNNVFDTSLFAVQSILTLSNKSDHLIVSELSAGHEDEWDSECNPQHALILPASSGASAISNMIKETEKFSANAQSTFYRSILNTTACAYETQSDQILLAIIADGSFNTGDSVKFRSLMSKLAEQYPEQKIEIKLLRIAGGNVSISVDDVIESDEQGVLSVLNDVYEDQFSIEVVSKEQLKKQLVEIISDVTSLKADESTIIQNKELHFTPKYDTARLLLFINASDDSQLDLNYDWLEQSKISGLETNLYESKMKSHDDVFKTPQHYKAYHLYFDNPLQAHKPFHIEFNDDVTGEDVLLLVDKKPYLSMRVDKRKSKYYVGDEINLVARFVDPLGESDDIPKIYLQQDRKLLYSDVVMETQDGHSWSTAVYPVSLDNPSTIVFKSTVEFAGEIYSDVVEIVVVEPEVDIRITPDNGEYNVKLSDAVDFKDLEKISIVSSESTAATLQLSNGVPEGVQISFTDGSILNNKKRVKDVTLVSGAPIFIKLQYNKDYQPDYGSSQSFLIEIKSTSHVGGAIATFYLQPAHEVSIDKQTTQFDLATDQPEKMDVYALLNGAKTNQLNNATLSVIGLPWWMSLESKNKTDASWQVNSILPFYVPRFLATQRIYELNYSLDTGAGTFVTQVYQLEVFSSLPWMELFLGWLFKVLLAFVMILYVLAIFRKNRFGPKALIEIVPPLRGRKQIKLSGSFISRWLIPYVPEKRTIEGVQWIAGNNKSHVYIGNAKGLDGLNVNGLEPNLDSKKRAIIRGNETVSFRMREPRQFTFQN